jgi:hypothetical protein
MSNNNQPDKQIEEEKEEKDSEEYEEEEEESEESEENDKKENEKEEEEDEYNFNIPIEQDLSDYFLRPRKLKPKSKQKTELEPESIPKI